MEEIIKLNIVYFHINQQHHTAAIFWCSIAVVIRLFFLHEKQEQTTRHKIFSYGNINEQTNKRKNKKGIQLECLSKSAEKQFELFKFKIKTAYI